MKNVTETEELERHLSRFKMISCIQIPFVDLICSEPYNESNNIPVYLVIPTCYKRLMQPLFLCQTSGRTWLTILTGVVELVGTALSFKGESEREAKEGPSDVPNYVMESPWMLVVWLILTQRRRCC